MRLIEARYTAVCSAVEGVLYWSSTAAPARERRGVIDRLGELIRGSEPDTTSEAPVHPDQPGMQYRVSTERFPPEVLHIRDSQRARSRQIRRFQKIEMSTLCSRVVDQDLYSRLPNFLLERKVPLLRISDAVVGIDAVRVADTVRHDKSVLQRQWKRCRVRVLFSCR